MLVTSQQKVLGTSQNEPFSEVLLTNINRRDGCLGVHDWSLSDNAKVTLHERYWGTNQLWTMNSDGLIYSKHSKKCLAYSYPFITQESCTKDSSQIWKFEPSTKRFIHSSGKCLELPNDTSNTVRPQLGECHNGWQQKWVPTANSLAIHGYESVSLVQGSRIEYSHRIRSLELEEGKITLYNITTGESLWESGNTNGTDCKLTVTGSGVKYECNSGQRDAWKIPDDIEDNFPCLPPNRDNANYTFYVSPYQGIMYVRHCGYTVTLWSTWSDKPFDDNLDQYRSWCLCSLSGVPNDEGCQVSRSLWGSFIPDCKKIPLS